MKSKHLLLILSQVILVSLLTVEHISCEHTPTVFVLDTSDSDSPVSSGNQYGDSSSSNKSSQDESGKNTEIVTDEITTSPKRTQNNGTGAKSANDQNEVKRTNHQRHQQPKTTSTEADDHQQVSKQQNVPKEKQHSEHDHESHPADHPQDSTQNDEATASRHRESSASRRSLDTESQLVPARDKAANGQQPHHPGPHHEPPPPPPPHHHDHPPHHHDHPPHHNDQREQAPHPPSNQKPKSGITTTSTTTHSYDQDQVPKTEERLLISITSDEDDSYQKPPKSGGYNEEPGPHQQQPHHHQKRKPTFTISIQDPNAANKQNGGNGHQAVILRPTEDGIVIATLGSPNSNNKKPSGGGGILSGLIGAVSGSINQPSSTGSSISNNNNNNEPYQEPVNNPIRPISTTRSPHISEPYSNNNNNQPISSTLLGGSRPQQPWTDERPQKPTFDESAISETTRRPTSRPTYQDTSSSSSNQQHDYDNNNNNNNNNGGVGEQLGPKYPLNEKNCGIMHETRIVGGDEADPDDFMWMAAIIKSKPRDGEPRPFCGGSLITRRHILTAAHCLEGLAPRDVLVRLGGYDFEDSASSSSADFAIDQFRVPAQYSKKTHVADIAIMRLKTPLQPNDNYKTVCMPQPRRSYVGALGTVTGYGSQSQTFRRAAPKLRQVTVPIWENRKCAAVYKKNLTESFMCAGYEEGGKDACQGDSGGPLMTEGPEQKMMIVGVVSHGIGCGAPGYPGVYTRTSTFADWIEKNTKE